MTTRFETFRELLLHCFRCHDAGDSRQALQVINEYLNDPQAARPHEPFWSEHNIEQVLGFRITFTQDLDPARTIAAEEKHLRFCEERLDYWLSATAESYAHCAMAHFAAGRIEAGQDATKHAIRLAGLLGLISPAVAEAAAMDREHKKP